MAEPEVDGAGRAQSYLNSLVTRWKTPGIQYLVLQAERTLFHYEGGWANVRHGLTMDAGTTMMAYSMSKTITAAAVLQLVEAGALRLEDPIARYLDTSPYDRSITVSELLSHTSGIPNPIPLRWVHPAGRHDSFDEKATLEAMLRKHARLACPPGTRYAYSNLGYWLLGGIVERGSGQAFVAYVTDRVLGPLGISPRDLGYRIPDSSPHASGYLEKYSVMNLLKRFLIDREVMGEYEGPWLRIRSHYPNGPAFGGLVGTAQGFGRFLQDQLCPHSALFNDSTRGLFYTQQRTRQGTPVPMTLGWHIGGDTDGMRFYYKEGGGGGFHSMMRVYRSRGLATVVMTNVTGVDVKQCLDTADREFF